MKRVTENGTSRTYYFHTDGKAHKGWLTYKGKKYYFYKGNSKYYQEPEQRILL